MVLTEGQESGRKRGCHSRHLLLAAAPALLLLPRPPSFSSLLLLPLLSCNKGHLHNYNLAPGTLLVSLKLRGTAKHPFRSQRGQGKERIKKKREC